MFSLQTTTEGHIFGIALCTGVEEDDEGKAVSCTLKPSQPAKSNTV